MLSRRQSGSNRGVAEAQRHQVLHRRLAEVVVDAEGLLLGEHRAHDAVDLTRAGQVVAERLLEHDAHFRAVEAGRTELRADGREEVGARRQVHDDDIGGARVEPFLQAGVIGRLRQVLTAIEDELGEARELFVAGSLGAFDLLEALLQPVAVTLVGQVPGARTARMRPPAGSLPCRIAWKSDGISLRQVRSPVPCRRRRGRRTWRAGYDGRRAGVRRATRRSSSPARVRSQRRHQRRRSPARRTDEDAVVQPHRVQRRVAAGPQRHAATAEVGVVAEVPAGRRERLPTTPCR